MANETPDLTYVNSSNGKIFVDGIILDDCYDIQYSYREMKEPLYGYNSKYYDAIVDGTVIIHGSFTINYKHDGYLKAILEMGTDDVNDASGLINSATELNKQYRNALIDYRQAKDNIKAAQDDLAQQKANKAVTEAMLKAALDKAAAEKAYKAQQVEEAQNILNNIEYSIPGEDQAKTDNAVLSYDAIAQAAEDSKKINLEAINTLSAELTDLQNKKRSYESQKAAAESKINTIKAQIKNYQIDKDQGAHDIDSTKKTIDDLNKKIEDLEPLIDGKQDEVNQAKKQYSSDASAAESNLSDIISDPIIADKIRARDTLKALQAEEAEYLEKSKNDINNAQDMDKEQGLVVSKATQTIANRIADKNTALYKITAIKSQLDSISPNWNSMKNQSGLSKQDAYKRAEDCGEFNIFVNYNGLTHKIIEGCVLTGHSHVIQQGGEAIKEYYSFIGQKIR